MTSLCLIDSATQWVIDKYPYHRYHLENPPGMLQRIRPGSRESVRLAALTHDMERAFPGPDQPIPKSFDDPLYYRLHSERSARIVGEWLLQNGADKELALEVEKLILVHEFGGWPEA